MEIDLVCKHANSRSSGKRFTNLSIFDINNLENLRNAATLFSLGRDIGTYMAWFYIPSCHHLKSHVVSCAAWGLYRANVELGGRKNSSILDHGVYAEGNMIISKKYECGSKVYVVRTDAGSSCLTAELLLCNSTGPGPGASYL